MHMFEAVNPKTDFAEGEKKILEFWDKNEIFRKSVESRPEDREFVFYDGPPFATGLPHYGHLVPGTIKDVIPRFKTMQGYRVNRKFGWDCHGLPVENEMTKTLGIKGYKAVMEYGVAKFNEDCRSIVLRYTSEWKSTIRRVGRWVDTDHAYRTMDTDYMESIWWVFKQLYDKGLIYEGYNILPYSPALACPLSNFEVNLGGYQDVVDQAVTVRFKIIGQDAYFLAWTTTPWTLPSNLALALGKDIDYVKVLDKASGDKYILGEARLGHYYKDSSEYEILEHYKGSDLKGLRYEPLFPYFKDLFDKGAFITVLGDYVTTEDGCGIVHTAPGFGVDDYEVLKGTGIPVVCPIDEECCFTSEVPDYQGIFVKDADKTIIEDLKKMGKLVKRENYLHSYPFCYRTHKPLIYRAMTCWFVNVTKIKQTMLECNDQINWVPDHIKYGRFGKWLEGAKDWAISRNRFWGNPIPIWKSDSSDYIQVVGSRAELEKLCGKEVKDLHKHFIDDLTWPSPDGKGTMHRIPDVLDCWFESGSMPYAQQHYPFENKEEFEKNFPADFICEGQDQTRGWFYTLVIIAAALFDKPAFYNCVVNGIILAADGKKMSKSERNFTDPLIIVEKYGADALRFAFMDSPAVRGEDLKFSEDIVKDVLKNFILPLWNSYYFFVTYANLDGFVPEGMDPHKMENPLDKWIFSDSERLVKDTTAALEAYDIESACDLLALFIDNLNNWYIRRSRRRFWKSESDTDKKQAYETLYAVLMKFIKLACPIVPFITEEMYQNLKQKGDEQSIHLCSYPIYDESLRDYELEKRMELAMKAISMGRSLRSQVNLKIRQPLQTLYLVDTDSSDIEVLKSMSDIIAEELNVKDIKFKQNEKDLLNYTAKANFKVLGKKLGKFMKEVAQKIEALDSDTIAMTVDGKTITIDYSNGSIELGEDDLVIQRNELEGVKVLNDGKLTVGFDTRITKELLDEGIARDLVRTIQNMRKDKGFEVSDRISLEISGDDDIREAYENFKSYICSETLSVESAFVQELDAEPIECSDKQVRISIKVVK
jgi:isoleucyl-tRNA synthetase